MDILEYIALPPVDIIFVVLSRPRIAFSSADLTNLYPNSFLTSSNVILYSLSIRWSVSIKLRPCFSEIALPNVDFPHPAIPIKLILSIFSKLLIGLNKFMSYFFFKSTMTRGWRNY